MHERLVPWLAERPRVGSDEVVGYHFEQSYLYRTELGVGEAETRTLALRAGERLSAAAESALVRNDLPAAVNLLTRATALQEAGESLASIYVWNWAPRCSTLGRGRRGSRFSMRSLVGRCLQPGEPRMARQTEHNYVLSQLDARAFSTEDGLRDAERALRALRRGGDRSSVARAWLSCDSRALLAGPA